MSFMSSPSTSGGLPSCPYKGGGQQYVPSTNQLTDFLTKSLGETQVQFTRDKLGTYDLYAPV